MKTILPNNQGGFTLIELIFTLVVAGVLITIAVPQFTQALRNNDRNSQLNVFVSSLNLARSEAVTRGARVTMCRSTNGATCNTDVSSEGNWESGWIVYVDLDADGIFEPASPNNEPLIRVFEPLKGSLTLRSNYENFIGFLPTGTSVGNGFGGTFRFCDDRGASESFNVVINQTGRVMSEKGGDACPL
jgi:type IV fimbrial biogenesis protein FimT